MVEETLMFVILIERSILHPEIVVEIQEKYSVEVRHWKLVIYELKKVLVK